MKPCNNVYFLYRNFLKFFILMGIIAFAAAGCDDSEVSAPTPLEQAMSHTEYLSETIGKRAAGTQGETDARDYIGTEFMKMGLETTIQNFEFTREVDEETVIMQSSNVSALLPGRSSKQVIVGAHYDSVNYSESTGATDNASGVAVMLALADYIKNSNLPYTVKFIAFGAEEVGLKGSRYYAGQMSSDEIADTVGMLNLDTLASGDMIYVYGGAGDAGWIRDQALAAAKNKNIPLQTNPGLNPDYPEGTTGDWSDHAPFKDLGIDVAYFESTNWEIGDLDGYIQTVKHGEIWHTDKDTLEFLNQEYPGRVESQINSFIIVLTDLLMTISQPQDRVAARIAARSAKTDMPDEQPVYMTRQGEVIE